MDIKTLLISEIASSDKYLRGIVIRSFAAMASLRPRRASKGMNCLARLDLGMGARTVFVATFVPSNLVVSFPGRGLRRVTDSPEDRILTVLRPDTQHCFLQCFAAQLLSGILKHIQLQVSVVLHHIIAGETDPADPIGWIDNALVESTDCRQDHRSCIGFGCQLRSAPTPGTPYV